MRHLGSLVAIVTTVSPTATIGGPVLSTSQSSSSNLTPTLHGIIIPYKYEETEAQKSQTQGLIAGEKQAKLKLRPGLENSMGYIVYGVTNSWT